VTALPYVAVGATEPYATGLTPGTLYYWRVDEVNDAEPDSPWQGPVWNFLVRPTMAWRPDPPDGARFIEADRKLTWQAGTNTVFHTVYFGPSPEAVGDAAASAGMTVEPRHDPVHCGPAHFTGGRRISAAGLPAARLAITIAPAPAAQAETSTIRSRRRAGLVRLDPQINFDQQRADAGT
jgi:hypothetical protein